MSNSPSLLRDSLNLWKAQAEDLIATNQNKFKNSAEVTRENFNKWKVATNDKLVNNITRMTENMAGGVDWVLQNMPDSAERDRAIRKLMAPYAPSPVAGAEWSIINSVDFDFEGFAGHHLSDYTTLHQLPHVAASAFLIPSLIVLRDMSLASKLAYEDPVIIDHICKNWRMQTSDALNFAFKDLRAFIMHDQENIVLSFRGTEIINPKDWSTDVKLKFVPMNTQASDGASPSPDEASPALQLVHFGFYQALGLTRSFEGVSPFTLICGALNQLHQANPARKIWVNGHSLGGALASVFVAQLILNDDHLIQHLGGLYTFGQPRCGNDEFAKLFSDLVAKGILYRTVNNTDLVCKVPMKVTKYMHHKGKVMITGAKLVMRCKGELIERIPTITRHALPPNSTMKKIMFSMLPGMLEDHYPTEYVRNLQLFI